MTRHRDRASIALIIFGMILTVVLILAAVAGAMVWWLSLL